MWRGNKPKPLSEVDRWINEGQPAAVEVRLNAVAQQYAGRSKVEVRGALQAARIPAPASVINGLATRISVLEPAQEPRTTVRMRTQDPR